MSDLVNAEFAIESEPLEFSPSFAALAKALIAAKKAMEPVRKNAKNPAFNSKYADLASVIDAVEPALLENGIAQIQGVSTRYVPALEVIVQTMLLHESGEFVKSKLTLRPVKGDPQGAGAAATYGRRYGLQALCGVAPEDDDGNAASGKGKGDGKADPPAQPPAGATGGPIQPPGPGVSQRDLVRVRALFDRSGIDERFGSWLEANVAPGLSTRPVKMPTVGELAVAEHTLQSLVQTLDIVKEPEDVAPHEDHVGITPAQRVRIMAMFNAAGMSKEGDRHTFAAALLGDEKASTKTWTADDYDKISKALALKFGK